MDSITKNAAIKQSIQETREKHAGMICRVFEIKVVSCKLSKEKKEKLDQYFREAKWLRNSELAKGYENMNRNAKTADVKIGDRFEARELRILGSQVRQDIVDSLKSEIRGLATKKAKGEKVGHLKFKSVCNSIPLRQHGNTYVIDFDHDTIAVQNMRKLALKVRGLKQIPADADIANAKLIRKPSGYYFHITTFCQPEVIHETGCVCGIDFGIGHNLTFDNGDTVDICVPESKGIRLAAKRMNKSFHKNGYRKSNREKKSKNHYKRVARLQKAYEKQNNRKADLANKAVHNIIYNNDLIAMQDEMIANWHKGLFGKQVQHSAMGIIKAKLKTNSKVHIVERSFPSTQICPVCGQNTKHTLSMREYNCQYCGYHHPNRDAKAANSILAEVLKLIS